MRGGIRKFHHRSGECMSEKARPARPAGNGAAEGNVDQIRDILFGGQMRDYERRFHELEERIRREAEKLRVDLVKRMDGLEGLLRDQHEQVQGQLKRVDREWREAAEAGDGRLQAQARALKQELSTLEQKHDADTQALRERLHKLGNESADALRARVDELLAELERVGGQLREDKVARAELAGFFSEMALRLNREFDLPQASGNG